MNQTPQKRRRLSARARRILASGSILAGIVLFVFLWPLFSGYGPDALSDAQFQPPNAQHWLGTDLHGRDLLARVCYGARISIFIGLVGAAVSLVIGVCWGAVAALAGGRWDSLMMRFVDLLFSLPSIVFVIVIITTLEGILKPWASRFSPAIGSSIRLLFLFAGLGAVSWLNMARIVRGQVLSLKQRQFIDASRALGAGPFRIFFRHVLPNIAGVALVYAILTIPAVILYESFLSYLGLGIQPPQASLGSLIAEGAAQINPLRIYWWIVVFPALILVAALLALNFLADSLRER